MIHLELRAVSTLLDQVYARPELPVIEDAAEHHDVAVFRRLKMDDANQEYWSDVLSQTEEERLSVYPNWEIYRIYITEYGTSPATAVRSLIDEAGSGNFDLIITDSIRTFSHNIDEVLIYVDTLRHLPHPVHVLFECEKIYTKTQYDALLKIKQGEMS